MWKTVEAKTAPSGDPTTFQPDINTLVIAVLPTLILLAIFLLGREVLKGRKRQGAQSKLNFGNVVDFRRKTRAPQPPRNLSDPTRQMAVIARASFRRCRLLNREEARILPIIERACAELNQGHRVMAQTSLGEVLTADAPDPTTAKEAVASINSKRLDIAVIDRKGYLAAAVEYQGTGHHQKGAFMRDAVKREALRKAGIIMIEVLPGDDPAHIRAMLLRQIAPEGQSATA